MPISTSVKYFHSAMPGAPVLYTAGSFIAVLDACLVNGFGSQSATISVASGLATATLGSAHPFEKDTVVLVSGAAPIGLNGEHRVLSSTATTITFDATGIPTGAATGTIFIALAPAGWTKPFSGSNVAVYRSPNELSTRFFYRMDDSSSMTANIRGYESMTSADVGLQPFPLPSQATPLWLRIVAMPSGNTVKPWLVVADDRTVYVYSNPGNTLNLTTEGVVFGFGDFAAGTPGDSFAAFIDGMLSTTYVSHLAIESLAANSAFYTARSANFFTPPVVVYRASATNLMSANTMASGSSQAATWRPTFPNEASYTLLTSEMLIRQQSSIRGTLRGLVFYPQSGVRNSFPYRSKVVYDQGLLAGRTGIHITGDQVNYGNGSQSSSCLGIDITGPWA
jgi:hypothetical protein